jgi:hypothetical protein
MLNAVAPLWNMLVLAGIAPRAGLMGRQSRRPRQNHPLVSMAGPGQRLLGKQGVRTTMAARPQGEAEIPLDALRRTTFPKLVTSGGHHPVFEAMCDVLHRELKTERAIIRGAGHNVQFTGAPFNERIEAFLKSA